MKTKPLAKHAKPRENSHYVILILGSVLQEPPHLKDSAGQIHLGFIHVEFYLFLWLRMALSSHQLSSNLLWAVQWQGQEQRGTAPTCTRAWGATETEQTGDCFLFLGQIASLQPLVCAKSQQSLPTAGFQEFNHPVCIQGHGAPAPAWKQQQLVKFSVKNKNK